MEVKVLLMDELFGALGELAREYLQDELLKIVVATRSTGSRWRRMRAIPSIARRCWSSCIASRRIRRRKRRS
ncbi:hypothetical protein NM04_06360 [Massilia aurea]|uniref:Uncharacterized protein n=1 Tax=Massilia aurea TaxID=373040 RepID=A0A422QNQ3_9BURK|nr:hypothetical protein NM04_06360 [Massilia aurea]